MQVFIFPQMIKRLFAAALLLAPGIVGAACYSHPETGVTYCTSAQECPAGKPAWSAATQACSARSTAPRPALCTGTDSGSYKPEIDADQARYFISAPAAMWSRVGGVVRVDGKAYVSVADADPIEFAVTLPVPSAPFAYFEDLVGEATAFFIPGIGQVYNQVGGDKAHVLIIGRSGRVNTELVHYSYTYRITGCH